MAGTGSDLGNLEFLVVFAELDWNMVKYIQDPCLFKSFGIFDNVLFVILNDLSLQRQGTGKISILNKAFYNGGHAAHDDIVEKSPVHHVVKCFIQCLGSNHMAEEVFRKGVVVPECPQVLLKIQRIHLVIGFVSNTVAFNTFVAYTEERSAADDVKPSVLLKEFQCRSNVRILLDLIKKQQSLPRDKCFRRIDSADIFYHMICIVTGFSDRSVCLVPDKIDLDNALVAAFGKMSYGFGFPDLPCPLDDERHPVRILSPTL